MADSYKMQFVWSGTALQKGSLQQLRVDGEGLPWESIWGAIPNLYMQHSKHEAASAGTVPGDLLTIDADNSLTVHENQCVMLPSGKFLYMDVGCWLKGSQYFGLIWGCDAWLCQYAPGLYVGTKFRPKESQTPIDEFLSMPGVGVRERLKIPPPFPICADRIYLVLPDMHVPEAPPLNMPKPSNSEGFGDLNQGNWRVDPTRWDEMAKRDLFSSRQSISDMIGFLRKVRAMSVASQITLVHVGDMYELWADRDCYFRQIDEQEYYRNQAAGKSSVQLTNSGVRHTSTAEIVGGWVAGIHDMHWELFSEFDACAGDLAQCIYLHGNHDSYMSSPEVVDAANETIQKSSIQQTDWGPRQIYPVTKVHPRTTNIETDHIFIEHGQRFDWANRDGNRFGCDTTNEAVHSFLGIKKKFDSTRRETFVAGATLWWTVSRMSFGLYVQGHTHHNVLKYVEVSHVRSDNTWVPVGKGARIQVETKKSL